MPVLETDPNEERGQLSISKNYKNKKTQETIPKLRKNDVCFDNKEDETGQKILKILGFKGKTVLRKKLLLLLFVLF